MQYCSRRKVILIITLLLLIFSGKILAQSNMPGRLLNVETMTQPDPQIVLTFNKPVNYKLFSLPEPSRLVVDIINAQYNVQKKTSIEFDHTDISDFRHGIQDGYNLRIVFDLKQSTHFSTTTQQGKTFHVFIHLMQQPEKLQTKPQPKSQNLSPNLKELIKNDVKLEALPKANKNSSVGIAPLPRKEKFVVIIDPGHGGKDSGARGPQGILEKNVTLAIAKDLESFIDAQPNMKAILTRKDDYYVGLRQRLAIARKAKGDLFIAIHADAFEEMNAKGASVYALSLHGSTSEAALWLSQKENYSELGNIDLGSIENANSEIRSVLIDLSQAATISASLKLGQDTLQQLGKLTELHHDCVEQAPFMVLKSPDIPSVLVETGFITNPEEEIRLKTHDYQEKLANALMSGIKAYCQQNSEPVQKQPGTAYTRSVDEI